MKRPFELKLQEPIYLFPNETAKQEWADAHPKSVARLGLLVCFMYHTEPDLDKAVAYLGDAEERITFWHQREFVIWLGGVALNYSDDHILRLANRKKGSFDEIGWRPLTSVKWEPTEDECADYAEYQGWSIGDEWEHLNDEE